MRRLRTLLNISWRARWLFVEAVVLTALARLAIKTLPAPRINRCLGRCGEQTGKLWEVKDAEFLREVQWAVTATERYVPWQARCLVQAMAARSMLARRGVAGTIYLGVAKDVAGEELQAHAWLRVGNVIVTGREAAARFTVITTFAFGIARNDLSLTRKSA